MPTVRTQLHHLVARMAEQRGDAPAVTFKDRTLSYARLWEAVDEVAAGLQALGVRRGERIAVYLDKGIETVLAIFGASAASAVFVPVNPLLRSRQVAHILADCDVRVLVTSPERLALLQDDLDRCKSVEHVVLVGTAGESGRDPVVAPGRDGVLTWDDLCQAGSGGAVDLGDIDLDMAAILYTSGSTGSPKGVVFSHRNLLVGAESVTSYLRNVPDDVILSVLPLSFDAGFSQITTAFHVGAHVVLMNYLLPADVVTLCARHGVTGLTGVPPLWNQLTDVEWSPEAVRSVRYIANTGGRMPLVTLDKLRRLFADADPYLMYGLTEAFRSTYLDPAEVDRRPDSIGKAIPNAEILVVRPDGSLCDPGEPGELVHRGALVTLGYWNDPERTAERFRPAPGRDEALTVGELAVWSGDTVVRDEEGFLYFVSRMDDMIKSSGYRISPTEVEEAVYETGLVRDVVALGLEDLRLGQRIVVVVTGADGAAVDTRLLVKLLRSKVPHWMVPSEVIVREELPRSANGKFDRSGLRRELTEVAQ